MLREELPEMTEASLAGWGSACLILMALQPAMRARAADMPKTWSVRRRGVRCMWGPWSMGDQGSGPAQAELALMDEVKMPELDCCELRT